MFPSSSGLLLLGVMVPFRRYGLSYYSGNTLLI